MSKDNKKNDDKGEEKKKKFSDSPAFKAMRDKVSEGKMPFVEVEITDSMSVEDVMAKLPESMPDHIKRAVAVQIMGKNVPGGSLIGVTSGNDLASLKMTDLGRALSGAQTFNLTDKAQEILDEAIAKIKAEDTVGLIRLATICLQTISKLGDSVKNPDPEKGTEAWHTARKHAIACYREIVEQLAASALFYRETSDIEQEASDVA